MALESATYLDQLVITNPPGGDPRSTADDHLRLIKEVLKNTFPNIDGVVSATPAEVNLLHDATVTTDQINYLGDVSASVQSQINAKLGISSTAVDTVLLNNQSAGYYLALGNATGTINDTKHGTRGGGNLHAVATSAAAGFMSAAHKAKLDGVESGATGDQSGAEILSLLLNVDGASSGLDAQYLAGQNAAYYRALGNATGSINDSQHGSRSGGSLHNVATTGANGFMSSTDKAKLNNIESGATADQSVGEIQSMISATYVQARASAGYLQSQISAGYVDGLAFVINDTQHGNRGGGTLHSGATSSQAGFMSAAHHNKLDGIESGATADQSVAEIQSMVSAGYVQARASAGYVDSTINVFSGYHNSAGSAVTVPSGWATSQIGTGYYRVTHNLGLVSAGALVVSVTIVETNVNRSRFVDIRVLNTNYFEYEIVGDDGSTAVNKPAMFMAQHHR